MTTKTLLAAMFASLLTGALTTPTFAQDDKKEEAAPAPHCSPKIGEMCDKLGTFSQTASDDLWKVAIYGSTACSNSRAIQTERRARRDRAEYEARVARAAKEKGQEHKAWVPSENNEQFNARTNGSCDGSYVHYCAEMRREADGLKKADDKQTALEFVDSACGAQTAAAAPAAATPAAPAKK
ncbi:MAG: hypothetical protein FJX59_07535 [Alphaproteobacteria bacterium]|nr:hypothetical protein [Alphaproteobacteria bacterium]